MKQITVRFADHTTVDRLDTIAGNQNISRNELVAAIIESYLVVAAQEDDAALPHIGLARETS